MSPAAISDSAPPGTGAKSIGAALPSAVRSAMQKRLFSAVGSGAKGNSVGWATMPRLTPSVVTNADGTGQRNASVA